MAEICVVVDNRNLVPLLVVADGATGAIPLTTISAQQNRARIEIFHKDAKKTGNIYTLEIGNLGPTKPELDLHGSIRGETLSLELLIRGKTFHRASINLRKAVRREPKWWIAIPLLLVALAAALTAALAVAQATGANDPVMIPAATESPRAETPSEEGPPQREATPALQAESSSTPEAQPDTVQTPVPIKTTVYFLPDDASLTEDTKRALDLLLPQLAERTTMRFTAVGHCALAGTERGRIDLSISRAESVYTYLSSAGFLPETQPELSGLGGKEPVTRDPDLQHLNRRVEIAVEPVAEATE